MNKLITVVLLLATSLSVCAQGNNFFIKSINTNYAKIRIKDSCRWISAYKEAKLSYGDSLMIESGTLKLGRIGYSPRTIYKTSPISIGDAWNGKYKKSEKPYTTIWGILSVWGIKMGEKDNDSIRFCFITNQGEWRTDYTIHEKDTIEEMAINHASNDTLYAYVFWELREGKIIPQNDLEDSICTLLPNHHNVFYFKTPQPVTWKKNSAIYLCYSKTRKNTPNKKYRKNSIFLTAMRREGFEIVSKKMTYENE